MSEQEPKRAVYRGGKQGGRKLEAGFENIACTLYNVSGPTFVEKIGTFLDGYRSSFRPRYFKPHKVDRRSLHIN